MSNKLKEWIQYGLAVAMMISGAVLAFISFFIRGDVTDNVLFYVGECIMFAGGIFGVTMYWNNKGKALVTEVKSLVSQITNQKKEDENNEGE